MRTFTRTPRTFTSLRYSRWFGMFAVGLAPRQFSNGEIASPRFATPRKP